MPYVFLVLGPEEIDFGTGCESSRRRLGRGDYNSTFNVQLVGGGERALIVHVTFSN